MKRKTFLYAIALIVIVIIVTLFLIVNPSKEKNSPNYQNALSQIEKGNQYVVEKDISDVCFPYRVFSRGCYYDTSKIYLVSSDLQNRNLTHEEIVNLCYKFAHKGSVAYCLVMNNEKQKCSSFAEDNTYLNQICDLEKGEVIPSRYAGPYNYSNCYPKGCENLPVGNCTDIYCHYSQDSIEPIKYSDLT